MRPWQEIARARDRVLYFDFLLLMESLGFEPPEGGRDDPDLAMGRLLKKG